MNPKFSIITATYNAGDALLRSSHSLNQQSLKDFEWLLVDGKSSDGSLETLHQSGALQPDVLISERDSGIADAWNKGIALATGESIVILNAGDVYAPAFLETMARHARPGVIVVSAANVRTEQGRFVRRFTPRPQLLSRAMHLPHNWCAVPRDIYREFGPYRLRSLAMDFDWFHRYFLKRGAAGFAVVDEVLGDYFLGGTSDRNFQASFEENERILVEHGMPVLQAKAWRWIYTAKHALRSTLVAGAQ